jgi:hypothetical protein
MGSGKCVACGVAEDSPTINPPIRRSPVGNVESPLGEADLAAPMEVHPPDRQRPENPDKERNDWMEQLLEVLLLLSLEQAMMRAMSVTNQHRDGTVSQLCPEIR